MSKKMALASEIYIKKVKFRCIKAKFYILNEPKEAHVSSKHPFCFETNHNINRSRKINHQAVPHWLRYQSGCFGPRLLW